MAYCDVLFLHSLDVYMKREKTGRSINNTIQFHVTTKNKLINVTTLLICYGNKRKKLSKKNIHIEIGQQGGHRRQERDSHKKYTSMKVTGVLRAKCISRPAYHSSLKKHSPSCL